jgi:hypothetical protein
MSADAIRAIILIVVTAMMLAQASRAGAGSFRRRAFFSGAAGFGIVGAANAVQALGIPTGGAGFGLSLLAVALIGWSMYMLFRAYRAGEMNTQFDAARRAVQEERERNRQQ